MRIYKSASTCKKGKNMQKQSVDHTMDPPIIKLTAVHGIRVLRVTDMIVVGT